MSLAGPLPIICPRLKEIDRQIRFIFKSIYTLFTRECFTFIKRYQRRIWSPNSFLSAINRDVAMISKI